METLVTVKIELEHALNNLKQVTGPIVFPALNRHIDLITQDIIKEVVRLKIREEAIG